MYVSDKNIPYICKFINVYVCCNSLIAVCMYIDTVCMYYMYVCMCVYMYVCMYCMYVCMCVCMYVCGTCFGWPFLLRFWLLLFYLLKYLCFPPAKNSTHIARETTQSQLRNVCMAYLCTYVCMCDRYRTCRIIEHLLIIRRRHSK